MSFVLDASVALAWHFEDEVSPYADRVLNRLREEEAIIPAHWVLEVTNALLNAERRGRVTVAGEAKVLEIMSALPLSVRDTTMDDALGSVIALAREQRLSAYDAAYLDLAIREGVPLATQDARLRVSAERLGLTILES